MFRPTPHLLYLLSLFLISAITATPIANPHAQHDPFSPPTFNPTTDTSNSNSGGIKPYQASFFGPPTIDRKALKNPLLNPYTNPYGMLSAGVGAPPPHGHPGYGAYPGGYDANYAPPPPGYGGAGGYGTGYGNGGYGGEYGGFTHPGEPLPPIALEPVLEPIDLMNAPKNALPKPPSVATSDDDENDNSDGDGDGKAKGKDKGDTFLSASSHLGGFDPHQSYHHQHRGGNAGEDADEEAATENGKVKNRPLRNTDEPKGVAGTGWYLQQARKDHKVSPAMGGLGWEQERERRSRFNPKKGGLRGVLAGDGGVEAMGRAGDEQHGERKHDDGSDEERENGESKGKGKKRDKEKEKEQEEPEPEPLPEVEVKPAKDGRLKYEVNIGGYGSNLRPVAPSPSSSDGADGGDGGNGAAAPEGPSNYHTWSQEKNVKLTGDSMDPECQKYIQEKMLPKMGGRRRKGARTGRGGSAVFSVFGDD
ncbi:hypothetical protein EX30DRAFT_375026 [Ascodesmis nigricans]|uniref:Pal1-domain-containing protein n=1 Tax=Ascodesmis nigricans TaxID=341454 RepID=A0A4S2MJ92_9PEZI|nr:hypothetical protein EX30DRAFT_375026 [Ascodesmis nigricans]